MQTPTLRLACTLGCLLPLACLPAHARPYTAFSGLTAAADGAQSSANNPAGITRLENRTVAGEFLWFSSESEWESQLGENAEVVTTKDSGDTYVPRVYFVEPINESWAFSFTFLGAGFSEDFGAWKGRYFIESYDSIFVSAYPSLAYKINDQWSVAGSIALTYSSFEQERAVANIFDPGFGDGRSTIETDSLEVGYGLSLLYQQTDTTRWGLHYQSEIEAEQEGDNDLSGLGPNTREVMERLGLVGADVTVESTSPQSLRAGFFHEFENNTSATVDLVWIDFSNFRLSEFYFNGDSFAESDANYDDIYAITASYSWPVSERWNLGVSGLATTEMLDDEDRTVTFRIDAVWALGLAGEWRWDSSRTVNVALSYMRIGDAPVTTDEIPGVGSLEGEYSERYALLFEVGMNLDF